MSGTVTEPLAPRREVSLSSRLPWWVQVLGVHAAARAVSAVLFLLVARTQAANYWMPQSPSYTQYTGLMWDASWYRQIAEQGYPASLPLGADGAVEQNAWAFFPLFPGLVRLVMSVTGAAWQTVAPTLALLLGAAAMLVVHQLVVAVWAERSAAPGLPGGRGLPGGPATGRRVALATVAVLTTFASAPVLQVGYTEALALLLLAAILWCLVRRHHVAAMPLVVALGFTRAVALPVAGAVLVAGLHRWRADRRGDEPWPVRERLGLAALLVVSVASGFVWPAICGWVTGDPQAYAHTQAAWRGRRAVVPFLPWLDVSRWLMGGWGPLVLVAVVALAVVTVLSRPMRRLGPVLQGWAAGYLLYLLAVVEPGTSVLRFLLLAFPVAGVLAQLALAARRPRLALTTLLVLGVLGQAGWIGLIWRLVPPSGWPP